MKSLQCGTYRWWFSSRKTKFEMFSEIFWNLSVCVLFVWFKILWCRLFVWLVGLKVCVFWRVFVIVWNWIIWIDRIFGGGSGECVIYLVLKILIFSSKFESVSSKSDRLIDWTHILLLSFFQSSAIKCHFFSIFGCCVFRIISCVVFMWTVKLPDIRRTYTTKISDAIIHRVELFTCMCGVLCVFFVVFNSCSTELSFVYFDPIEEGVCDVACV